MLTKAIMPHPVAAGLFGAECRGFCAFGAAGRLFGPVDKFAQGEKGRHGSTIGPLPVACGTFLGAYPSAGALGAKMYVLASRFWAAVDGVPEMPL